MVVGGVLPVLDLHGQDPTRFESAIIAFEIRDENDPPPVRPVLFVGSSSIVNWKDLPDAFPNHDVLQRGFGGSVMTDVLYYFDRVIARYGPALVIVYEGDNDLANGTSVEKVFQHYASFVDLMEHRLPESDFGFIAVKPSPSRRNILNDMSELNARLSILAAERGGLFIDVFHPMLDAEGEPRPELFGADDLHMNSAGYRIWRSIIGPVIDQWAASKVLLPRFTAVKLIDGMLVMEWDGDWRLSTAPAVDGPWTHLESAVSSPFNTNPQGRAGFFRLEPRLLP